MESYMKYIDQSDGVMERFSSEPLFPMFAIAVNLFNTPPEVGVQLLMTISSFFIILPMIIVSNNSKELGPLRTLSMLMIAFPFILFSAMVPRYGLAVGMVLCAMARVQNTGRIFDWKVIFMIVIGTMSHNIAALFCTFFILFRRMKYLKLNLYYMTLILSGLWTFYLNYPELIPSTFVSYVGYVGEFRETGSFRMAYFVVIAVVYITIFSLRVNGVFSDNIITNCCVALIGMAICIFLYFFVSSDSIRFTYIIGILMVSNMFKRMATKSPVVQGY